jgi:hypothetical protein
MSHGTLVTHRAILLLQINGINTSNIRIFSVSAPRYLPKDLVKRGVYNAYHEEDHFMKIFRLGILFKVPKVPSILNFRTEVKDTKDTYFFNNSNSYIIKENSYPFIIFNNILSDQLCYYSAKNIKKRFDNYMEKNYPKNKDDTIMKYYKAKLTKIASLASKDVILKYNETDNYHTNYYLLYPIIDIGEQFINNQNQENDLYDAYYAYKNKKYYGNNGNNGNNGYKTELDSECKLYISEKITNPEIE